MSQGRTAPLLILALLVVAGLGAGAWTLLGSNESAEAKPVAIGGLEPGRTPDGANLERPVEGGATLQAPDAREPGREAFVDGPAPENAIWIEGRVLPPPGMPADDTLAVVALGYPSDVETKRRPRKAWRALKSLKDGVTRTHRTVDAANGSFRIPVDERAATIYVYVDGRYAFLREPIELTPDSAAEPLTIEPELGAWLTGTVRIPLAPEELAQLDDPEIGLAIIESDDPDSGFAFRFGGSPDRSTPLDKEGHYSFRGLEPDALHDLAFRHDDYLPAMQSKLSLAPGQHEVIDLDVDVGARVAGRVVTESGDPVEDATVRQERGGFMDFMGGSGRAKTGADGTFIVKGLRPGEVSVKATHDDYVGSEPHKVTVAEGETLRDVVLTLPTGKSIAGQVLWPEGEPAVGARVFAEQAGSQEGFNWTRSSRSVETGDDGRFNITGLDGEMYHLRASISREPEDPDEAKAKQDELEAAFMEEAGPFAGALREQLLANADISVGPRWTARATDIAAGTSDVVMTLEPPMAIEGFVRDETGAPVTTFTIEADPVRDSLQFLPGVDDIEESFEDPGGAFVLEGLQPGRWRIRAEADGYAATGDEVVISLPDERDTIEIVLARASRISGVVLDPSGQPVPEADVRTGSRGGFRGAGRVERSKRRSTTTDAEGTFTLEDVPAEGTVVGASAEGWADSDMLPIDPQAGDELTGLVLQLKLGGTLTGEVLSTDGPVGATRVRYNSMSALSTGAVTTEEDGTFRVEHLTPGTYQVMVEPDPDAFLSMMEDGGEQPDMSAVFEQLKMVSAEIKENEVTHVVLGEAPKNPVQVYGRLTEAGEPVSGKMVIAMAEGEQVMSSLRMDQTDDDGRFELKLKQPGGVIFSVQLDAGSNPQFFEDVPEVETYEVDLQLPTGKISGTIFDPRGDPASNISVRISSDDTVMATMIDLSNRAQSDAGGNYSFGNLAPGSYTVRAGGTTPFGSADGSYGTHLVDEIRVDEGEHEEGVDIHLSRAGRIEGIVRMATGTPANGAAVFVRDAGGRLLAPFSGCVTDAAGRFTYEGIAPGSVTVSARLDNEASYESGTIDVREGEAAEIEIQLEGGTMLIVTLAGDSGEAQRAQVRVFDSEGREHSGMAAPDMIEESLTRGFSSREHRIGPLPAGRYRVVATTPGGEEHKKLVNVRSGRDERRVRIKVD